MSKPDIVSQTSAAGIAVDPRTLERVIPESRRPDGTYVPSLSAALFLSNLTAIRTITLIVLKHTLLAILDSV